MTAIQPQVIGAVGGSGPPPIVSDTVAQLNFDAWPLVDEVAENDTFASSLISGNLVTSPVITGSTKALQLLAGDVGEVDSEPGTMSGLGTRALEVEGFTLEYFVRFDGARGTTWDVEGDISLKDDDGNEISLSLEVLNSPSSFGDSLDRIGFNLTSDVLDYAAGPPPTYFIYSAPDATYVHIALVVDVNVIRVYAAGVKKGEMTAVVLQADKLIGMKLSQMNMLITGAGCTADRTVDCYRCSRGALYDADFTPPTTQFAFP